LYDVKRCNIAVSLLRSRPISRIVHLAHLSVRPFVHLSVMHL